MRSIIIAAAMALVVTPALADFRLTVTTWGDIPLCTSGRPNTVPNPPLVLRDIPEGTTRIDFELVDLNVPGFDHGGGRINIASNADGTIPAGTFRYRSPCPPGAVHTYEWRATARAGRTVLARASSRLDYPQ